VLEEDPLPLISTDTVVLIKPVGRQLNEKADTIFRGDMNGRRFGPVNVGWFGDGSLWIGYCSGRISTFHNYWSDLHAGDPTELEVVLGKEAPGHWPKSGPPNGQSGPPPCP
jgi:hypothetical protein